MEERGHRREAMNLQRWTDDRWVVSHDSFERRYGEKSTPPPAVFREGPEGEDKYTLMDEIKVRAPEVTARRICVNRPGLGQLRRVLKTRASGKRLGSKKLLAGFWRICL
ncbi:hypothetical protein [Parasitella parasitica]|uniref:Uncharacterized protein n=1 Tax=Parasitella parasitica TaxID=35722 RepID=A0A0B7N090_9FUNG|nr:hypothetical protein [Parasitella parasitica]